MKSKLTEAELAQMYSQENTPSSSTSRTNLKETADSAKKIHALNARVRDLEKLFDKMQKEVRSLAQSVSGLAHHIHNIKGGMNSMQEEIDRKFDDPTL